MGGGGGEEGWGGGGVKIDAGWIECARQYNTTKELQLAGKAVIYSVLTADGPVHHPACITKTIDDCNVIASAPRSRILLVFPVSVLSLDWTEDLWLHSGASLFPALCQNQHADRNLMTNRMHPSPISVQHSFYIPTKNIYLWFEVRWLQTLMVFTIEESNAVHRILCSCCKISKGSSSAWIEWKYRNEKNQHTTFLLKVSKYKSNI